MSQSCSSEQLSMLLDFLAEHKDLAKGLLRTSDGRSKAKRLWEDVAQLLNAVGGSVKTVQQWQKVWTDRKHVAKKNAAAVRKHENGTGGGPAAPVSLAQWELRVLNIMGEGFGGPQTTACVPAFPEVNLDEEVAQYQELEVLRLGSERPPNASVSVGASGSGATEEQPTPTIPIEATPASRLSTRRARRPRRPQQSLSDRLVEMEKEKINVLNSINARLSGIEKAILELVKLKQNNNNNNC